MILLCRLVLPLGDFGESMLSWLEHLQRMEVKAREPCGLERQRKSEIASGKGVRGAAFFARLVFSPQTQRSSQSRCGVSQAAWERYFPLTLLNFHHPPQRHYLHSPPRAEQHVDPFTIGDDAPSHDGQTGGAMPAQRHRRTAILLDSRTSGRITVQKNDTDTTIAASGIKTKCQRYGETTRPGCSSADTASTCA